MPSKSSRVSVTCQVGRVFIVSVVIRAAMVDSDCRRPWLSLGLSQRFVAGRSWRSRLAEPPSASRGLAGASSRRLARTRPARTTGRHHQSPAARCRWAVGSHRRLPARRSLTAQSHPSSRTYPNSMGWTQSTSRGSPVSCSARSWSVSSSLLRRCVLLPRQCRQEEETAGGGDESGAAVRHQGMRWLYRVWSIRCARRPLGWLGTRATV